MKFDNFIITAVKAKDCYYITDGGDYHNSKLTNLLYDGGLAEKTHHKDWFKIPQKPNIIQQKIGQPNINYRFEIKEGLAGDCLPGINIDELPKVMPREEVMEDNGDGCDWKLDLSHLRSLYELKSDPQDPILEKIDFIFEVIMEIDCNIEPKGFSYDIQRTQWASDGLMRLTEKSVQSQLIDKIVFPEIVLPERPCKLTSKQSFDIVRQYIKQNINYGIAEITSDYDFCFTVKKIIGLNTPYTNKTEIKTARGKSFRKRRFRETYVKERMVEVFEMAPKLYQNYTVLKGFEGKNQKELKNNIDNYLNEVISIINTPLIDCPNCNGMGIIESN